MTGPDDITLNTLLAPPPRLGWRYQTPSPPLQHAMRQSQPAPLQLPPAPRALKTARLTYFTGLGLAAASVLTILLGLFHNVSGAITLQLAALCVGGYVFVSGLDARHKSKGGVVLASLVVGTFVVYAIGVPVVSGLVGFVGGVATLVGFPGFMILRGKYLESQAEHVDAAWSRETAEMQQAYAESLRARDVEILAYEAGERKRWRTEALWHQVRLPSTATALTVVGGSAYGWEALVTTFGTSLLADGRAVTLLNFSERAFAAEVCAIAAYRGLDVGVVSVPDDLEGVGLLAGFTSGELAGLLADTLHAGEDKLDRKSAISDRDILTRVCDKLVVRPLSIERVRAGLRVVLRSEPWSEGSVLDQSETSAVQRAFSDDMRQRTNLIQSAWDIERQLGALAGLAHGLGTTSDEMMTMRRHLQVFELRRANEALDNDYVVDLLFQLLLRSFRRSAAAERPNDTIIIAGADRLRSRHLTELAKLAERTPVRFIYLYEQYGPDARQMVGRGGGCAAFMTLGNDQDAKGAADFIGRDHKFVVTGLTRSTSRGVTHSDSTTETESLSSNFQPSFFGLLERYAGRNTSRSWGITRGISESTSETSGTNEQRVYDLLVEPYEIQQLPETAFFFVQVESGVRQVLVADCNPDIAGLARVDRGSGGGPALKDRRDG